MALSPRFWTLLRSLAVTLVLLAGTAVLGVTVHRHYPIQSWLFFRYAGYWLGTLALAAGFLGMGHVVVRRLLRVHLPLHAHLAVALAVGISAFQITMFLLGAAQLYHPVTFFAMAVLPPALTAVPVIRDLRPLAARLRARRARPFGAAWLALLFGLGGLAMVYFAILTPENVQFDARWKHMALAEDFVVHGGLRRFPEGWVFSARPHSTSFLYAWAFLLPRARLFDQMVLSAHLEFAIFLLSTSMGIGALVRRLVPGADPRWVWAARFLFPGVFLYDSSVCGGADHVGAAFAIPVALVLLRVLRDRRPGPVLLLCALLSGAALVKETIAIMLLPFPLLLLGGTLTVGVVQALRNRSPRSRREALTLPLLALATGVVLTAPLWLTNLVFYGDPFYPLLGRFLEPQPWSEAAAYRLAHGYLEGKMWAPTRDLAGLGKTLAALFTFSFVPNDWGMFHRNVPVFGSLFTLLLATLPFLRKTRAVWLLVGWIFTALFAWYSVHHQDRYLQGLMPLLAAVTAALLLLVWRSFGPLVRGALGLLVALQIVWGGDVYFIQTHVHARSVVKKVVDLLSAGHEKKYEERFAVQTVYQGIGASLPAKARVLLHLFHEQHTHLGLRREAILDSYLWQYGIEYDRAGDPEAIRSMLAGLGATHVFAAPAHKTDGVMSITADISFWEFVDKHLQGKTNVGAGILGRMPEGPIPGSFGKSVAVLTCHGHPARGLFRLEDLRGLPYGPLADQSPAPLLPGETDAAALRADAGYAVVDEACLEGKVKPPELVASFDDWLGRLANGKFPAVRIWRRKP